MLMSHARNGNEFQTPGKRWLPPKHWDTLLLFLVSPKLVWIHETWHAIMEQHQHAIVKFLSNWGQVLVYASHNSHDGFGRERPTFGDETISIASYCFQNFTRVNIEQQECCVNLCDFSGFVWTFLCINCVFNAFMCMIQIWTTCTCSSAYKLVEKSNLCPWVHA